jgi:hypothetical protein
MSDNVGLRGHLRIIKKSKDGVETVLLDDKNMIVSGMGFGLSHAFTGDGSDDVNDYIIDRFQVGVSGPSTTILSSLSELYGPLTSVEEYGAGSNNLIEYAEQLIGDSTKMLPSVLIPMHRIKKSDTSGSVEYILVLDEESCNNIKRDGKEVFINEIGMLMRNPTGNTDSNRPILVCYKTFNQIKKTNDFSLIFRWTIFNNLNFS